MAADPVLDKVVVTVGDQKITAREYNTFLNNLPEQYRAQAQGGMKRRVGEQYAEVKLLAQEARKRALDRDPAVQAQIAFQLDNILAGALFKSLQEDGKADDAAARQYYEEHKAQYEQVQARHILVRFKGSPVPTAAGKPELSEEQALAKTNEIRKKLLAGEDFAKLAKEESSDTGSAQAGGNLGTFRRGQMVPEFDQAAFSLPAGQVSEPIKTQFGYHLVLVDKHESKSFEQAREEIDKRLRPETAKKAIEQLKSGKIVLDEGFFGPAAPAPAKP